MKVTWIDHSKRRRGKKDTKMFKEGKKKGWIKEMIKEMNTRVLLAVIPTLLTGQGTGEPGQDLFPEGHTE